MNDSEDDGGEPFPTFRSQKRADAHLPEARAVVDEVIRQLPHGLFDINPGTLFVGRSVPEEVACFAAGLTGIPFHVAPVVFDLGMPFDETVESIVDRLLRWRARVENE